MNNFNIIKIKCVFTAQFTFYTMNISCYTSQLERFSSSESTFTNGSALYKHPID